MGLNCWTFEESDPLDGCMLEIKWSKKYPPQADMDHIEQITLQAMLKDGRPFCFHQVHDITHPSFSKAEAEFWAHKKLQAFIRRRLAHEAIHKN